MERQKSGSNNRLERHFGKKKDKKDKKDKKRKERKKGQKDSWEGQSRQFFPLDIPEVAPMEKIMKYFPFCLIGLILLFAFISELVACRFNSDLQFLPTFGAENRIRILG